MSHRCRRHGVMMAKQSVHSFGDPFNPWHDEDHDKDYQISEEK